MYASIRCGYTENYQYVTLRYCEAIQIGMPRLPANDV